jgi:membrane fusion protein (multidrug efflux system)
MSSNHHKILRNALIVFVIAISSCKEKSAMNPPKPQIPVLEVIQKDVPIYREFVGQVYGMKDIPIRARVDGYLEEIAFQEGRAVRKGDLLYRIDSQPFLAEVAANESKVAEAQTYLVNAENELARYKPLAEINAVSKSDLDAAQASRDAAEASLRAAKANLRMANINLGYCTIRSPIDGLIGKTEARVGEYVGREPNPVILNMVSNIEETRVQFFLTEAEYLELVRPLNLRNRNEDDSEEQESRNQNNFQLVLSDGSLYEEKGNFDFIDRNVDVSTGAIMIQAVFPNPNRILRPGMYAKVRVLFEVAENAILVPQRCIMELQGQYSVFLVDQDNIVQAKQVSVGEKLGDLSVVTSGLQAGDKVVLEGMQKVGTGVGIIPVPKEFESQSNEQD